MTIRPCHGCWASCAALWRVPRLLGGWRLSGRTSKQGGPPSASPAGRADTGNVELNVGLPVSCPSPDPRSRFPKDQCRDLNLRAFGLMRFPTDDERSGGF